MYRIVHARHSLNTNHSPTATFIQTPTNTTVCLGSTAQFVCSATGVINVFYLVDSMAVSNVIAPIYIGNITIRNLTILGTIANNNSLITCLGAVSNGSPLTSSAYLSIQGQPAPRVICFYVVAIFLFISLKLPLLSTHQVLHLLPLILILLHTMVLPPNWPGDHPLMPSPQPSSPML